MVLTGGWGGLNPIPLVQQGALRDWMEALKGIRTPVPVKAAVAHTPAAIGRTVIMALASAGFMAAYARIVDMEPGAVTDEQLFRDIQLWMRSLPRVSPREKPRRGPYKRGAPPMAPVPLEPPDVEDLGFFRWLERRRYRDGRFYTPDVRGTV